MERWSSLVLAMLASLAACAGGGCAGTGGAAGAESRGGETAGAEESGESTISAAVRGVANGLEVLAWSVADNPERIEAALGRYVDDPSPLREQMRERWRRCGLRMVRVPIEDLHEVRGALPIVGRLERRWLGQATEWLTVHAGAHLSRGEYVSIDGSAVRFDGGRLRLLARAWTRPSGVAPMVRTDVAIQLAEPRERDPFAMPRLRRVDEEGLVMRRLTAELTLEPGYAYVIVAAPPEVEWESDESSEEQDGADAGEPDSAGPIEAGPPIPQRRTIGEALMISRMGPGSARRQFREVIVLAPRAPRQYRAIP